MNDPLRSLVEDVLRQEYPLASLCKSFQWIVDQPAVNRDVLLADLTEIGLQMREAGREEEEDRLLEAMDFLAGWCSPQSRISRTTDVAASWTKTDGQGDVVVFCSFCQSQIHGMNGHVCTDPDGKLFAFFPGLQTTSAQMRFLAAVDIANRIIATGKTTHTINTAKP